MTSMIDSFMAARRVATPLIMVKTPDPAITKRAIAKAIKESDARDSKPVSPLLTWNCIRGIVGANDEGGAAICKVAGTANMDDIKSRTTNATEAMELAQNLPESSVLFVENAHQGFDPPNPNFIQAVWLLRDLYKRNQRMLVMLTPGCTLPPELAQDVYTLDEPLPSEEELGRIVDSCFRFVTNEPCDPELRPRAIDAVAGLASFPAEQVTAMSMFRDKGRDAENGGVVSLDLERMWERKRQIVEATPGLSIYRGAERFDDIGGLGSIKQFLRLFINGKRRPRVVLFMDEIEKMVAGSNDTSGTSQALMGKFLTWTQRRNRNGYVHVNGMLLLGHPGVGKSMLCKACGNEAGTPTVIFDLGSTKSSLVGSSEARMDQCLRIVDGIGNGEILLVASCNKVEALSPEFRSRFQLSTWFFDLPTADERATIWAIHRKRFGIDPDDAQPDDEGWVGREVESCCQLSYLLSIPLVEAAKYIAPSYISSSEQIASLRNSANGRYLSASYPGHFKHEASRTASGASRAIEI